MPQTLLADLSSSLCLAALPTRGGYFDPIKIALFLLMLFLWAHNSAWAQEDIKKLRVPVGFRVLAIFFSGFLGLVLWLLLPWFWAGILLFVLLYGAALVSYVVFRNRRVAPAKTVLTMAHFNRLTKGKGGPSFEETHAKDRARIKDHNGATPPWPKDPEEHAGYQGLQDLLFDAIWRRASDVRIKYIPNEPLKIVYKIDGVDRAREPVEVELAPFIVAHIKRISGMDPEEQRRPQSGRFKATIGAGGGSDRSAEIEARTSGTTAGQRVQLRLMAEESKFRPPDLGFTKDQLPIMEKLIASPRGVMIVCGPRDSGITSTLYAFLRTHDAFMQNIHTLEIATLMEIENITQHVYDSQDGAVTFAKHFRSILRTEPDITMAGDTPDPETLAYAAASGHQGKKVYLAMTARSTFSALRRYLQDVGDNALAASGLLAIISQRLVRILCADCRRGYKPDPALLKKANLPTGENRPFYRPPNANEIEVDKRGNQLLCPVCQGSGYLGRTGVFEILVPDDNIRALIANGTPLPTIKAEARKKSMLYLQEVAIHKVYEGVTSINEVLRVTKENAPKSA